MLNQTLKNNIAPWEEKGRWYHAFIESDGNPSLTMCDLDNTTVSGTSLTLPQNFHMIDYRFIDCDIAASKTLSKYIVKTSSSRRELITLPTASDYTYIDLWFFGYFTE